MARNHSAFVSLQALHYSSPIIVLCYYAASRAVAACFLHRPSKRAGDKIRRYPAISLLFAVNCTLVGQAIAALAQSILQPGWSASQDLVVYLLASILAYGTLLIDVLENSQPLWHIHLGSCFVGVAFEIPITVLQALIQPSSDGFAFTRLALQLTRSVLLVAFFLSGCWYALKDRTQSVRLEDEAEPLAPNTANGNVSKPVGAGREAEDDEEEDDDDDEDDGGADDSDEEAPDENRKLRKAQRKRLRETGSWLKYLLEFKIFVPMLWPYKNRLIQACLAIIFSVLIAERFLNVLVPRQLGIITNELTEGNGNGVFPWKSVGLWMFLSYINSRAGIYIIQSLAEIPVQQFAYKRIGATSFSHIITLDMAFHNEKNSGELIRSIDQGQNLQGLLDFICFQIAPTFFDLIIAFVYVSVLFDVYMSCILAFVGIAYIWVGAKTTAWTVKKRRRFNEALINEGKIQNEAINNWQTVSHFNRGQYECYRYEESIDAFNSAEMSYYYTYYIGGGLQTLIMVLGRLGASFLAVYRVSQGTVPVGNFVTLISYWRSIESPLAQVSWSIRRVTQMLTDSERLLQLFQRHPNVTDAPNATELVIKGGEVIFEDVDFAYDPRKSIIREVSFTAKPGQTVALVGETGGGKSTILKLLYRYYDIESGSIRIDGQDIRGVTLDSLRDQFGMVPQDPALFNISILENVRYARLDATDDEVKDACRAAAIHDKIETFPDAYKSTVGERGVKLSGGELQRISIARAILRQPKIVLLDEATSMIDAETEAVIQEAFKRLTASRTTFIIAHRLSTIQHADQILVVNDGQIVERGTHEELFRMQGKYVALWSKQLSKDVKDIGSTLHVHDKDPALIDLSGEEPPGSR